MSPGMRRLAVIGITLLLGSCVEPHGDLKEELKHLARDMRGKVPALNPAPALPDAPPPLTMERDPFSARGSQR
ncbi:MAG: hypothetical protein EXR33_06080 [Betaproteobacteria bacterium]|nr:hypothetical protein [Betaproteobacteria bacterium]